MQTFLDYAPGIEIGALYGEPSMTFSVRWERTEEEGSRPFLEANATFDAMMLGLQLFRRGDLVRHIGDAEVRAIEDRASKYFTENAAEYADAA